MVRELPIALNAAPDTKVREGFDPVIRLFRSDVSEVGKADLARLENLREFVRQWEYKLTRRVGH
jgi:hypothetical protein